MTGHPDSNRVGEANEIAGLGVVWEQSIDGVFLVVGLIDSDVRYAKRTRRTTFDPTTYPFAIHHTVHGGGGPAAATCTRRRYHGRQASRASVPLRGADD